MGRGEGREHHRGAEVAPGGVVESAAARYQAQGGEAGRAVDRSRREPGLGILAYARDTENSGDPVGEGHVDAVPWAEGPQAEEDGRPLVAVDMTFDDRHAHLAGGRR